MKLLKGFLLGINFGFGLLLSNIDNPKAINLFLPLGLEWNPSVLLTIGSIIIFSVIIYFPYKKNFNH